NGTFLNNRRISKSALKDDDVILIGKHTVTFKDTWHDDSAATGQKQVAGPSVPKMEATMVLDTKKAKEMIAAATASAASATAGGAHATPAPVPVPGRERTGTLSILDGKTDAKNYVLGKMS